jgi:hypothetical protein
VLYSSEHRTENFTYAYDNLENFITEEGLVTVPSLLYSGAVKNIVIREVLVRV